MPVTDGHVFQVGDRALYSLVNEVVEVEVLETRSIGVDGPRFVRIRMEDPYAEPVEMVLPEKRLRPVSGAA